MPQSHTQDVNALELVFSTNSADTAVVSAVVLDDAGGGLLQLQQEAAVAVAPTAAPLQSLRLLLRPSKRVATKLRAQVGDATAITSSLAVHAYSVYIVQQEVCMMLSLNVSTLLPVCMCAVGLRP
jgi:hypothetical protein